ncbi:DUF2344 domain-containing protein [Nocardiopsis ansamitocini]|uniref:Radical SAM protein n=1 Tax=Nocardiopsis ansamitocini TaxID=1670832 RepID=A0A9W6P6H5_9ACTN|nr:DUF2344 domain-containing protein [Nocardiopsis ansamitocini]GLU47967.1 radical SAM protein [Nocardiopsis ansamitocini]
MQYDRRHRRWLASDRDAVRMCGPQVPTAFSTGFSPHPTIPLAGAVPTGAAREAKNIEPESTKPRDPEQVRVHLDASMPEGMDVIEAVQAVADGHPDRPEASERQSRLPGVPVKGAVTATTASTAVERVETQRPAGKGHSRLEARSPFRYPCGDGRATEERQDTYAILRLIVGHTTPALRTDDVVTGLCQVAGLAPPSSLVMTRLAQGPLDEVTGATAAPSAADHAASEPATTVVSAHVGAAFARARAGNVRAPQGL